MFGVSIKQKGNSRKDRDIFVLTHEWVNHFKLNTTVDADQDFPAWVNTLTN